VSSKKDSDSKPLCPRCGEPGHMEIMKTRSNTYKVFVHYIKGTRGTYRKKCYLGAERYKYVNRFNPIGLVGAYDKNRFAKYFLYLFYNFDAEAKLWFADQLLRNLDREMRLNVLTKAIRKLEAADRERIVAVLLNRPQSKSH